MCLSMRGRLGNARRADLVVILPNNCHPSSFNFHFLCTISGKIFHMENWPFNDNTVGDYSNVP